MITRKLSKAQGFVVQGLAAGLAQLQAQANEAQAALNEQAELLCFKYGLPEGESRFTQGADGWAIVVKPKPEPKTPETGDITDIVSSGKLPAPEISADGTEYHLPHAAKPGPEETKVVEE